MRKDGVLTYLHADHLGSTALSTDASGNQIGSQQYNAYGAQRGGDGVATENRFTGQKQDASGLQYFNARYFDPQIGMFVSPDTIMPDAGNVFDYNRFMYVRGRVMSMNDPSGHSGGTPCGVSACVTPSGEEQADAIQLVLDVVGIVDPTPISDGSNVIISAVRGNWQDAGWSLLAVIPFVGDLGKAGKYSDEAMDAGESLLKYADNIPCANSFSAETLVMTARGLRPISEVIEGDLVLAWDEATGKIGYFVVTATISHEDRSIVLLTLDGETLETTAEHPFFVVDGNEWLPLSTQGHWVEAGELRIADAILQADGETGRVVVVDVVDDPQRMYNLTVDRAHTFFVGEGQWLVHNAGCGEALANTASSALHQLPEKLRGATIAMAMGADGKPVLAIYGKTSEITEQAVAHLRGKGWNVLDAPKRGIEYHAERQLYDAGYTEIGISRQKGMCSDCEKFFADHPNATVTSYKPK